MDKLDKEVYYFAAWKLIDYSYGFAKIFAVLIGIVTILYFLNGMEDSEFSGVGIIILWSIIIPIIIIRNILKPYFKKKTNDYMD